jgi:2-polyprenyl-3-methyl-5-hydroxy-6-metoxy-1,4-benzoquinol methylase
VERPSQTRLPRGETDYALGRTGAEYDRLIEQAELMRPLTDRMLSAAGVCAGMHVLDVGCGVGDVSFLVSQVVGEQGSVLGVDVDAAALRVAEARRGELGVTNVEFRNGDASSIGFERPFDAVVGRFVVMFLSDPTAALRHFAASLRPGGIVAFQEWVGPVTGVSALRHPLLAWLLDILAATFERSGARLEMGTELFGRMRDAGLEPDPRPLAEIGLHVGDSTVASRRWASFARSMLPKIVEYGLATEAELGVDTLEQRLRDELSSAGGVMPLTWLMVSQWGRKPTS